MGVKSTSMDLIVLERILAMHVFFFASTLSRANEKLLGLAMNTALMLHCLCRRVFLSPPCSLGGQGTTQSFISSTD